MTTATKHMVQNGEAAGVAAQSRSVTVAGFAYGYAVTSLFSAVLVVLKESIPAVHDLLVAITGHHWVSHGIIDVVLFVALGWWFSRQEMARKASSASVIGAVLWSTIASIVIIDGYFLLAG